MMITPQLHALLAVATGMQVADWSDQAMVEHEAGAQGASMARHAVQLLGPLMRDAVDPVTAPAWAHAPALLQALATLAAALSRQLPCSGTATTTDSAEVGWRLMSSGMIMPASTGQMVNCCAAQLTL